MAKYTYLACDWRTRQIIIELPLSNPSFNDPLNSGGVLDGDVSLSSRAADVLDATEPCRTVVFVDRDGVLVWGGWLWTRSWNKQNRKLKIQCGQYDTYFWRRVLRSTLTYTQLDQLRIADNLINYAQGISGGNVGVVIGQPATTSGILRDRTYKFEETKIIAELIKQLSEVNGAFDYSFDVGYVSGVPQVTFNKFYPSRGISAASTPLVFEYPGNIIGYEWPEDGTGKANYTLEVGGQPEGSTAFVYKELSTPADLAAYPVLDQAINRNDIMTQGTLDGYAIEDARLAAGIVTVPSLTVRGDIAPVYGTYSPGDWCKVSITDERFPRKPNGDPGKEVFMRISDIKVTPASKGNAEKISLSVDGAV